jgi:hypothetical protein
MRVPFSAYAEDCTVSGEVGFETDRLSDFLAATSEFEVDAASFQALEDGHVVARESASLLRDDLCVIIATGPRGREERRLWTRQFPVRARVGPYVVFGYLHAPPAVDPLRTTDRRTILALTSSRVQYVLNGESVTEHADTVLLNRAKVDVLEQASEADLGIVRGPELSVPLDGRSKDMTGEVLA